MGRATHTAPLASCGTVTPCIIYKVRLKTIWNRLIVATMSLSVSTITEHALQSMFNSTQEEVTQDLYKEVRLKNILR